MVEEFKRLKQHLNFLKEKYTDLEILYIGMIKENNKPLTLALYLPKADDILKGKLEPIKIIDNFNIQLTSINDSFEISLVDIRNLKEQLNTSFINDILSKFNDIIKSEYGIINKIYRDDVINYLNHLNFDNITYNRYMNKLIYKYIKNKMNWMDNKPTNKIEDINEYVKQFDNIYVTSDLHLFHKNILKYEEVRHLLLPVTKYQYLTKNISKNLWNNLPMEMFENLTDEARFKLDIHNRLNNPVIFEKLYQECEADFYNEMIHEHDKKLIENYNRVVGKNDLCFILGDFSLGKAKETEEALKQMNGKKILIKGNHDIFLKDNDFDKTLFDGIYDYLEVNVKGQGIVLSHYPILHFKKQDYEKGNIHLYGHTHTSVIHKPYHSYHVGVDTNTFKPILIEYAISRARSEIKNQIRYKK